MIELNIADLVSDLLLPLYAQLIFILPVLCSFLRDVALVLVEALLSLYGRLCDIKGLFTYIFIVPIGQ